MRCHSSNNGNTSVRVDKAQKGSSSPSGKGYEGKRPCPAQGFPDSFRFYGNVHNKHRQIGNAVPVPLAYALGRQLRSALEESARKQTQALMDAQLG